jgi:hypothetical protein
MSGLRDLLRFCYRSVEGTLLKPGVPDQTPAISNADANIPDSAVDDEEVQDKEDQKAFLIFEVRVASRSGGIHDFEGQVAATSGVVKDLVTEQLSFFNDQVFLRFPPFPLLSLPLFFFDLSVMGQKLFVPIFLFANCRFAYPI